MISINWLTKVIYIPQSYVTFVSGSRYTLDIEKLRNDLKNLEDTDEGMPYPDTHARNKPVTLSGVVYAQTFEILPPYTISFENTGTPYVVVAEGANHNIGDVTNFDGGMSLVVGNSGGLIVNTVNIGGGVGTVAEVADAVWNAVAASFNTAGTTGNKLNSAGAAGDPWAVDISGYNTTNTAGKFVKDIKLQTSVIETGVTTLQTSVDTLPADIRTELEPELTHLMSLENQTSGLTPTQATMILEMYELLGLDPTKPLLVTSASRSVVGTNINQNIVSDSSQTIVTRV